MGCVSMIIAASALRWCGRNFDQIYMHILLSTGACKPALIKHDTDNVSEVARWFVSAMSLYQVICLSPQLPTGC